MISFSNLVNSLVSQKLKPSSSKTAWLQVMKNQVPQLLKEILPKLLLLLKKLQKLFLLLTKLMNQE